MSEKNNPIPPVSDLIPGLTCTMAELESGFPILTMETFVDYLDHADYNCYGIHFLWPTDANNGGQWRIRRSGSRCDFLYKEDPNSDAEAVRVATMIVANGTFSLHKPTGEWSIGDQVYGPMNLKTSIGSIDFSGLGEYAGMVKETIRDVVGPLAAKKN